MVEMYEKFREVRKWVQNEKIYTMVCRSLLLSRTLTCLAILLTSTTKWLFRMNKTSICECCNVRLPSFIYLTNALNYTVQSNKISVTVPNFYAHSTVQCWKWPKITKKKEGGGPRRGKHLAKHFFLVLEAKGGGARRSDHPSILLSAFLRNRIPPKVFFIYLLSSSLFFSWAATTIILSFAFFWEPTNSAWPQTH